MNWRMRKKLQRQTDKTTERSLRQEKKSHQKVLSRRCELEKEQRIMN